MSTNRIACRTLNAFAVSAGLAGCASTGGTSEYVHFFSDPTGATVSTTLGHSCITPCGADIPRSETFTATFELNGAEQSVFVDTQAADGSAEQVAGSILFTPIIALPIVLAVNAANGTHLEHVPNPVSVVFPKDPPAGAALPPEPAAQSPEPAAQGSFNWEPEPAKAEAAEAPAAPETASAESTEEFTFAAPEPSDPPLAEPAPSPQAAMPELYEGSPYAAFTPAQIQAYCGQNWSTRIAADGRTEYNPCRERGAFQ